MEKNTYKKFERELGHVMAITQWAKRKGDRELIKASGGGKSPREYFGYLQTLVGNVVSISGSVESYSKLNYQLRN